MTIIDLFEKVVLEFAEHVAIVDRECYLTYKDINQKANQLATYLISSGLKANEPVGVLAYRDSNYIIAILPF